MNHEKSKKLKLKIDGMTCSSCEVLIESEFKKIPGVEKVFVHAPSGKADVYCSCEPDLSQFKDSVKSHGYEVSHWGEEAGQGSPSHHSGKKNSTQDYLQIGSIFFLLVTLYLVLK